MKGKFLELVKDYIHRKDIDRLLEWLDTTDWYDAPASTKFHLSCKGGLLEHSINVFERLKRLIKMEYNDVGNECPYSDETLAIVSLFHDFCKIGCYKSEYKNVKTYSEFGTKRDAGGRFDWESVQGYKFDEDFVYGYHGPKSVYLIQKFIELSPDESRAIATHMGAYDRPNGDFTIGNVFEKCPLALLLHTADCMASFIDEIR